MYFREKVTVLLLGDFFPFNFQGKKSHSFPVMNSFLLQALFQICWWKDCSWWTCHKQNQICPINKLERKIKELTWNRHLQGFYHLAREQNRISRKQLQIYLQEQHCTWSSTNASRLAPRCSHPPPCEGESPSVCHFPSLPGRWFHKQRHFPTSSAWRPVRQQNEGVKIRHFSGHVHLAPHLRKNAGTQLVTINLSTLCQFLVSLLILQVIFVILHFQEWHLGVHGAFPCMTLDR